MDVKKDSVSSESGDVAKKSQLLGKNKQSISDPETEALQPLAKSSRIAELEDEESGSEAAVNEVESPEKFTFFYTKESPFSQFYAANFEVDGVQFTCAEMFMMYHKAKLFEDKKVADQILRQTKPGAMKGLGRKVRNFDQTTWDMHKCDIVRRGNVAKFSQNPHLLGRLLATVGTTLVEASPRDCIWGIGRGASDPLAKNRATWRGRNLLGGILTDVREELKTKA